MQALRQIFARWLLGQNTHAAIAALIRASNEERDRYAEAAAKMVEMIEHTHAVIERNAHLKASLDNADRVLMILVEENKRLVAAAALRASAEPGT